MRSPHAVVRTAGILKLTAWMVVVAACGGAAAPAGSTTAVANAEPTAAGSLALSRGDVDGQLAAGRLRLVTLPLAGTRDEVSMFADGPAPARDGFVMATNWVPGGSRLAFCADARDRVFVRYESSATLDWHGPDGRQLAPRCFRGAYALGPGQAFVGRIEIE